MQTFRTFVSDARKASLWLKANGHLLRSSVEEPWVVMATDEQIEVFLARRSCRKGFMYDNIRDHLLFNFNDQDDLKLFVQHTHDTLRTNICLFGTDYVSNNVDYD